LRDTQAISLDGNQLAFVYTKAFHEVTGLLSLALQNNNISFLGSGIFSNLNRLTTLLLHDNQLPAISPGAFDGLVSLAYIDLSKNQLKSESVPRAFLRRASKLRRVYLDDNQLEMIDSCILASPQSHSATRVLSVLGNPINCDCSMRWLLRLRCVRYCVSH